MLDTGLRRQESDIKTVLLIMVVAKYGCCQATREGKLRCCVYFSILDVGVDRISFSGGRHCAWQCRGYIPVLDILHTLVGEREVLSDTVSSYRGVCRVNSILYIARVVIWGAGVGHSVRSEVDAVFVISSRVSLWMESRMSRVR